MIVYQAESLLAAIGFLRQHPHAKLVAGGTDLLPRINQKLEKQQVLCYIGGLPGLSGISQNTDGSLVVGALTRLAEIAENGELRGYTALKQAASQAASPQIRNVATLGGNLMQENRCIYFNNAVPWSDINHCFKWDGGQCFQYKNSKECVALLQSDLAPVLIAYGAVARIQGPSGQRELPVASLYLPAGRKNLAHDELLIAIHLPALGREESSAYIRKTIRGSFDFPLLSCAVWLRKDDGLIADCRAVFGAAGVMPAVLELTEWQGQSAAELAALAETKLPQVSKLIAPFQDTRVNGAVRKDMARTLFRQAIAELI